MGEGGAQGGRRGEGRVGGTRRALSFGAWCNRPLCTERKRLRSWLEPLIRLDIAGEVAGDEGREGAREGGEGGRKGGEEGRTRRFCLLLRAISRVSGADRPTAGWHSRGRAGCRAGVGLGGTRRELELVPPVEIKQRKSTWVFYIRRTEGCMNLTGAACGQRRSRSWRNACRTSSKWTRFTGVCIGYLTFSDHSSSLAM